MMELGRAIRGEWGLDPDFLTLNHGSYGATPRAVLAAQDEWRARLEAQPTRFFRENQLPIEGERRRPGRKRKVQP